MNRQRNRCRCAQGFARVRVCVCPCANQSWLSPEHVKTPTILLSAILLIHVVASAAKADDNNLLRDFGTRGFDYGYEAWQDLATVAKPSDSGLSIDGPSTGGAGIFFADVQDLSAASQLELKIRIAQGNTARKLLFKLMTASGEPAFEKEIDLTDVSREEFTTVTMDLPKDQPRLGDVKQLQLQGTFVPGERVSVELLSISAIQK